MSRRVIGGLIQAAAPLTDPSAPIEKVRELREGLAEHYGRSDYLRCESMGALIRQNLESIRRHIGRPIVPELVPE